jgi:hypothetical protein
MSSANMDSLNSSFLFVFFSFFLPILLLWLGIPRLCSVRMEQMDTLISFLTSDKMVSVFTHLV